jgi:phage regulator Rha-like protein
MNDDPKDWFGVRVLDPRDWFIERDGGASFDMTPEGVALLATGWDNAKAQEFQAELINKFVEMQEKLGPLNARTEQFLARAHAALVHDGATLQFGVKQHKKLFRKMTAKLQSETAETKQLVMMALLGFGNTERGELFRVELIHQFREMEEKLGVGACTTEFWAKWMKGAEFRSRDGGDNGGGSAA